MAYTYALSKQAEKYLNKLGRTHQERVREAIVDLCSDPLVKSGPVVNSNPPARRARVGSLRIIFVIDEPNKTIFVSMIMSRGQVYERM